MAKSYKRKRRGEYPPIGDQMSAVYCAIRTLFKDKNAPDEVQAWFDCVEGVKTDIPKPGGGDEDTMYQSVNETENGG